MKDIELTNEQLGLVSGGVNNDDPRFSRLLRIFKDHCSDEIDEHTTFQEMNIDELDMIDICSTIEYEFNIIVDPFSSYVASATVESFYTSYFMNV